MFNEERNNNYTELSDKALNALKQFSKQIEKHDKFDGFRYVIVLNNGFGASVIKHRYSYGIDENLFELAVLDKDQQLCYDSPITCDVLGYLTEDEVVDICKQINEWDGTPVEEDADEEDEDVYEDY